MILHILSKLFSYIGYLALTFFLWWLIHPDSFDKLILHICRLMAFISKQHRKRYIAKYIEYDMAEALRKLEKYFKINLRRLKIEWADIDKVEVALEKEHIIIRLRHHRNMKKNIAETLLAYIPYTLPPTVKAVLTDETVIDGLSFMISRDIAKEDPYLVDELKKVIEEKYSKEKEKLKDFYDLLEKINKVHEQSLLIRLVIPEIIRACTEIYPQVSPTLTEEIRKFIDYTYKLVTGTLTDPIFRGEYFRVVVVRVAKPEKILIEKLIPHLNLIKKAIKKDLTKTICIVAAGPYKPHYAKKLTQMAKETLGLRVDIDEVYQAKYKGSPNYVYCAILRKA